MKGNYYIEKSISKILIYMSKEDIIPFLAMGLLLIGTFSTIYVHATTPSIELIDKTIIINNAQYNTNELFNSITLSIIQTDDGEKVGIPLKELIVFAGVICPSCHKYSIIAVDGYQQIVSWDTFQTGIFTLEHRVYFPELAHSFWVRNVIEIEVK